MIPAWLAEVFIVIIVASLAAGAHVLVQRRFSYESLRTHNDIAGFNFSVVGVIYAVVLGFIVVVAWQKYDDAIANTDNEIAAVSDLYRVVLPFPIPLRTEIRREMHQYIDEMIGSDWPAMAQGHYSNASLDILENVAANVDRYNPVTNAEHDSHQAAMQQVARLFDARRLRLEENLPSIPSVLWFALVSGAIATLSFAFLFGAQNQGAQRIMTGILAGVIAILFIVIWEFDTPFSGSVAIGLDGWTTLHERLAHIR